MQTSELNARRLTACLALGLVLLGAWLAYSPGTGGRFIFDDFANLQELPRAQDGGLTGIGQYVFDSRTGAVGRPLSLLSFAAQAHSWPHHPEDFIRVNILLHLANGLVLCWVLLRLLRVAGHAPWRAEALAVCAAAVWLVSPLQSGAVLYVVQRMAVLSGGCVLAGMLLYLAGRERTLDGRHASAWVLMTAGLGVALGPGVLAKENAALFPLLVLVAEFTVLGSCAWPRAWRNWAWAGLGVPVALLAAYLLWRLPGDLQVTSLQGVTTPERVLSQPRILLMYLQKMLLPSLYGIRIMYDDLPASTSLLTPWTTLPSLLACLALLALGLARRRAWPIASFAILWFFAAHLLEAGFIPLELAFDHRNYLAIAGPALLLVRGIDLLIEREEVRRIRGGVLAAAGAYFLFMGVAQWHTSSLWGRPYELAAYWAKTQPDSRRVSYEIADAHFSHFRPLASWRERQRALAKWPHDTANVVALLSLGCVLSNAPVPGLAHVERSLEEHDGHMIATLNNLDRVVRQYEAGLCDRYSRDFLLGLIDRIYASPDFRSHRYNYHLFRARVEHYAGNVSTALDEVERALAIRPAPDIYEFSIQWALQAGDVARARRLLAAARQSTEGSPLLQASYASRFDALRRRLEAMAPERDE